MKKLFLLLACMLLVACVTEEGAKKHLAKQHAAAADGLQWNATIYSSQRQGSNKETIGTFGSLVECAEVAMKHIREKGYSDGAYSCGA